MIDSKKILVVDSDEGMLMGIARKLQSIGYGAIIAKDAAEAISSVRTERPSLILLDVSFPPDVSHGGGAFADGFLLLSWLRRMDEARGTPIVMINGKDSPECVERARAAGAAGYFPKPINYDALMEVIARKLREPTPEPEQPEQNSELGCSFSS